MQDNSGVKLNIQSFRSGQIIFSEGQMTQVAYMIRTGSVEIYKHIQSQKVRIAHLGPGEIFGEMGALDHTKRMAQAQAAEYTELLVLDGQVLENLLDQGPLIVKRMMRLLIKRLRDMARFVNESPAENVFLSICGLVHKQWQLALARERKKNPVISYRDTLDFVQSVLLVPKAELDSTLDKLNDFNLISFADEGGAAKNNAIDRDFSLNDPDVFLQSAKGLGNELCRSGGIDERRPLFADINEFAEMAGVKPEKIYRLLAKRAVPENLLRFNRKEAENWLDSGGRTLLNSREKSKLAPDDLNDVDDLALLDAAVIKNVFTRMNYHSISILFKTAGPLASKKMEQALSKKMTSIIKDQAETMASTEKENQDAFEEFKSHFITAKVK